jgi:hypothetical protein
LRLTAARSTIELPGNENCGGTDYRGAPRGVKIYEGLAPGLGRPEERFDLYARPLLRGFLSRTSICVIAHPVNGADQRRTSGSGLPDARSWARIFLLAEGTARASTSSSVTHLPGPSPFLSQQW